MFLRAAYIFLFYILYSLKFFLQNVINIINTLLFAVYPGRALSGYR